jgi:hypothetical protein
MKTIGEKATFGVKKTLRTFYKKEDFMPTVTTIKITFTLVHNHLAKNVWITALNKWEITQHSIMMILEIVIVNRAN